MASPGNQHCAHCIGTLSFPISITPLTALSSRSALIADSPTFSGVRTCDTSSHRLYRASSDRSFIC